MNIETYRIDLAVLRTYLQQLFPNSGVSVTVRRVGHIKYLVDTADGRYNNTQVVIGGHYVVSDLPRLLESVWCLSFFQG